MTAENGLHDLAPAKEEKTRQQLMKSIPVPSCLSREEEAMIKTTLAVIIAKKRLENKTPKRKREQTPDSWLSSISNEEGGEKEPTFPTAVQHFQSCVDTMLQQQHAQGSARSGLVEHIFKTLTSFDSEQRQACQEFLLTTFVKHPQGSSQLLFRLFCCGNDISLEDWIRSLLLEIWPYRQVTRDESVMGSEYSDLRLTADEAVYFMPVLRTIGFSSSLRSTDPTNGAQDTAQAQNGLDDVGDGTEGSVFHQYRHLLEDRRENAMESNSVQLLWLKTYQKRFCRTKVSK